MVWGRDLVGGGVASACVVIVVEQRIRSVWRIADDEWIPRWAVVELLCDGDGGIWREFLWLEVPLQNW